MAARPGYVNEVAAGIHPPAVEWTLTMSGPSARAGFIAEGALREELRYSDQWADAITMSILAPEWKRHHGRP